VRVLSRSVTILSCTYSSSVYTSSQKPFFMSLTVAMMFLLPFMCMVRKALACSATIVPTYRYDSTFPRERNIRRNWSFLKRWNAVDIGFVARDDVRKLPNRITEIYRRLTT
jgi:hypothetical protein